MAAAPYAQRPQADLEGLHQWTVAKDPGFSADALNKLWEHHVNGHTLGIL